MIKHRSAAAAFILAALVPTTFVSAQTITLKMAANVPASSPWDIGLKRLSAEFARVSGGRVKIAFPQSAHVETESDIIQKMRLGVDGALLTTYGMAELYPDSLALSMPSFMSDDAEFDAVLEAVEPLIKAKLADRYVVLAMNKGGWVRYFSRSPIVYPEDLAKLRISIDPSDDKVQLLMESVGARVVTGTTADFLLQINSNAVDATCVSPIYIASLWSQLRGKIAYMSSFKVAPFFGAIVFNKTSWERVPADLRPQLEQVVRDMSMKIGIDSAKLENDAIAALDGISSPREPADAAAKWAALIAEKRNSLIAQMFSADILSTMDAALAKVRKSK
jgi:TRAP-type C4-dicarboxylate transport system substrate-binding protein